MNPFQQFNEMSKHQDENLSSPGGTGRAFFQWVTWLSSGFISMSLGEGAVE